MKKIQLGYQGPIVSELCIGTLPMGPLQSNIEVEKGAEIIRYALESGINFIDTAQVYNTYKYIAKAIDGFDRKDFVIASKSKAKSYEDAEADIKSGLKELGINYYDIFHLHAAREDEPFTKLAEGLKCLRDYKEKGVIKNIGIATHYIKVVKEATEQEDIDIIFPLINKIGLGIVDGTAEEMLAVIKTAKDKGKGIYAMKTLAGGCLINELEESINYVRKKEFIDSIAVGMVDKKEVDANIRIFNDQKLPEEMSNMKEKTYKRLRIMSHLCIKCGNCIEECPNFALSEGEESVEVHHSKCILCGYCTRVCPELVLRIA